MDSRRRDGLLAILALGGLLAAGVATDGTDVFSSLVPAAVGVVGALALEALFLQHPGLTRDVWERRGVAGAAALAVLVLGVLAVEMGARWVVAALAWGLVTYLVLLAGTVVLFDGRPA